MKMKMKSWKIKLKIKQAKAKAEKAKARRVPFAKRVKKAVIKRRKEREPEWRYQLILNASFIDPITGKPTKVLTGYSRGRHLKHPPPKGHTRKEMEQDAFSSIYQNYFEGDSEVEVIEDTIVWKLKKYDPVKEGRRLRREKKAIREAAKEA